MPIINGFLFVVLLLAAGLAYLMLKSCRDEYGEKDRRPNVHPSRPTDGRDRQFTAAEHQEPEKRQLITRPCSLSFRFYEIDQDSASRKAG